MLRLIRSLMFFAEQLAVLDEVGFLLRRVITFACLSLLTLGLALGCAGCLAAGMWLWADQRFGPIVAPFLVAGVLALGAVVVMLTLAGQRRGKRRAAAPGKMVNLALEGFLAGLLRTPVAK